MAESGDPKNPKEPGSESDLSGLLDLSADFADASGPSEFPVNQGHPGPHEEIQDFESLDQLGMADPVPEESPAPFLQVSEEPTLEPVKESPKDSMLTQMREYSEKEALPRAAVPAEYPFSLLIRGRLSVHEKEKLLDVIEREKMGFDEKDLVTQFEGERILIPRISEYAGILIIQALRATSAQMRLAPSDEIFATEYTRNEVTSVQSHPMMVSDWDRNEGSHPAEMIPMTSQDTLPEISTSLSVIDTLVATATLRTTLVEAEQSSEYQQVLEALQKELKYKAYHKGARGLVNFSVNLISLSQPSRYRLTVMATAVKN